MLATSNLIAKQINLKIGRFADRLAAVLPARVLMGILTGILTGMLTIALAADVHAAGRLYRYVNDQGNVVVSHAIPNDRVKFGYEVLDAERFSVVQIVEPQISEEEAERRAAKERAIASCEIAMKRVRALYRTLSDIDRAENQAVSAIDNLIANTTANLNQIRRQHSELQKRAARIERQGNKLPTQLIESIRVSEQQIHGLETDIVKRREAKEEAREGFDSDRQWFSLGDCMLASVE
jgi:hypothetical protein